MPESPYAPPKAQVADVQPLAHASWGRLLWVQIPLVAGLLTLVFFLWDALLPGLAGWGGWTGALLSVFLAYFPIRNLRSLSEAASPWWWDVIYYSSTAVCVGGMVRGDPNLVVAGGLPTLVILGATTVYALITERRRGVRVYLSGRRYLFRSSKGAF